MHAYLDFSKHVNVRRLEEKIRCFVFLFLKKQPQNLRLTKKIT